MMTNRPLGYGIDSYMDNGTRRTLGGGSEEEARTLTLENISTKITKWPLRRFLTVSFVLPLTLDSRHTVNTLRSSVFIELGMYVLNTNEFLVVNSPYSHRITTRYSNTRCMPSQSLMTRSLSWVKSSCNDKNNL